MFLQSVANFLASSHVPFTEIHVTYFMNNTRELWPENQAVNVKCNLIATGVATKGAWQTDKFSSIWTTGWMRDSKIVGLHESTLRIRSVHHNLFEFSYPHNEELYQLTRRVVQAREEVNLGSLHPALDLHSRVAQFWRTCHELNKDSSNWRLARCAYEIADGNPRCDRLDWLGIRDESGQRMERQDRIAKGATPIQGHRTPGDIGFISTFVLHREDYNRTKKATMRRDHIDLRHHAYIALGSNLGDRIKLLESACRMMNTSDIVIHRTSPLYETRPMYLEDQQTFLNGACEVRGECYQLGLAELTTITCRSQHR